MDKIIKQIKKNISIEITQKPGWDIFILEFYFRGRKVAEAEINGIELEIAKKN